MANKGRQNNTEVAEDGITSITDQNIARTICDLLKDDENVKKRVRDCIFRHSTFRLALVAFIVGIAVGVFLGHNYEPRETLEQTLENKYHLVPKDTQGD